MHIWRACTVIPHECKNKRLIRKIESLITLFAQVRKFLDFGKETNNLFQCLGLTGSCIGGVYLMSIDNRFKN